MGKGKPFLDLHHCRTVFFDLEFYVPESLRDGEGLIYNPWDKRCKFLGGCFYTDSPANVFNKTEKRQRKDAKQFWLWNYGSERELLQAIYDYLDHPLQVVRKSRNIRVSPILCGINICTSDIPVLTDLFRRFKILSNADAFRFQSAFRVIDLSMTAIGAFKNTTGFMYPKAKSELMNKFVPGTSFENGRAVWDMYDQGKHSEIERRVLDEVVASVTVYKAQTDNFKYYKALEKRHKSGLRLATRDEAREALEAKEG